MIKGIIFDVGGTLVYTNHDHFETSNAWMAANFLRSKGFRFDPEAFASRLVDIRRTLLKGDAELRQIGTTVQHLNLVAKEFAIELTGETLLQTEQAFVTPEACGSVALPGIPEVIKKLHERFKLGIISNTRSHILIEETLKYQGLLHYFDPLVTSVSAGYCKPSIVIFQTVLDSWKFLSQQVVMIGDSLSKDIAGAKPLGMKTVWLKTDSPDRVNQEADFVAEMPEDILTILQMSRV